MRGGALEVLLVRAEGLKHAHFPGLPRLSLSLSLCIYIFYFFTFLPFSIDDILFVFLNIFIQDPQIIMQSSNVAIRWLKAKSLQVSFSLLVVL
jgi:hypothetical protein